MGEMAILDITGDTKVTWDPDNDDEVKNAEDNFKKLVEVGKHAAFSVDLKGGKDRRIYKFDKSLEQIIFVPPMAGG